MRFSINSSLLSQRLQTLGRMISSKHMLNVELFDCPVTLSSRENDASALVDALYSMWYDADELLHEESEVSETLSPYLAVRVLKMKGNHVPRKNFFESTTYYRTSTNDLTAESLGRYPEPSDALSQYKVPHYEPTLFTSKTEASLCAISLYSSGYSSDEVLTMEKSAMSRYTGVTHIQNLPSWSPTHFKLVMQGHVEMLSAYEPFRSEIVSQIEFLESPEVYDREIGDMLSAIHVESSAAHTPEIYQWAYRRIRASRAVRLSQRYRRRAQI